MKNKTRTQSFIEYCAKGFANYDSAIKAGYSPKYAKTNSHILREKYENEIIELTHLTKQKAKSKFGITQESIIQDIQNVILQAGKEKNYQAQLKGLDMLGKITGIYERDNQQKINIHPDSLKVEIIK